MSKEFNQEWQALLKSIDACSMPWGIQGGMEWISYKQISEAQYAVQILTHGGFEKYKVQKDAIEQFFQAKGFILSQESSVKEIAFGYWNRLDFISKSEVERQREAERTHEQNLAPVNINTQINGNVDTGGGNLNSASNDITDNSEHSQTATDTKWFQKEIVKMLLSFVGGVGATLLAQYIMRALGWIV